MTPEQQKTIKVARVAYKNMLEYQLGPALREYVEMLNQIREVYRNAPWMPAAPPVDLAEQQRLNEVLAEVAQKETK
jgi:hypothetical protein